MNGMINVLKPPGMTSNNVVVDIRRMLKVKKVGHTGTLDPGAGGVLPICVGKATRLFDVLVDKQKEYICEITFGKETDTLDSYGQCIREDDCLITKEDMEAILPLFLGEQTQLPPLYSAIKSNGRKLYELARKGEEFDRETKKRTIVIDEIELMDHVGINQFLIRVVCSKGTYIRVLCEDIAKALGTCAYMSFLLRSRTGMFGIEEAKTMDELQEYMLADRLDECLLPMQSCLLHIPCYVVPDQFYTLLRNGVPLRMEPQEGVVRIECRNEFFGLGHWEKGALKIHTYLHE